jgi:hypothetical protein
MSFLTNEEVAVLQAFALEDYRKGVDYFKDGHFAKAIISWRAELAKHQSLILGGQSQCRANAANAHWNLSIALHKDSKLGDAVHECRLALAEYEALVREGNGQFHAKVADTRHNLATMLSDDGKLGEAVQEHLNTLADYQTLVQAGQPQYLANVMLARSNLANARSNLANGLYLDGKLGEAVNECRLALVEYQILIRQGQEKYRANAASARSHLATMLANDGKLGEAVQEHYLALADYKTLMQADQRKYRADAASARSNLAIALSKDGKLREAVHECRLALADFHILVQDGQRQYLANAANTRNTLANALADDGKLDQAVQEHRNNLEEYQLLIQAGQLQYRAYAAISRNGLGNALCRNFKPGEAVQEYRQTLLDYHALIGSGQGQFRANAAMTRGNFANALSMDGKRGEAVNEYRLALAEFQTLLRGGQGQYRAEAADVHHNFGAALHHTKLLGDATKQYLLALAEYETLIRAGKSQYRAKAAMARGNLAIALAESGLLEVALEQHRRVLADYQTLVNAGHVQYRADAALARGNLANALSMDDKLGESVSEYRISLVELQTLIQEGQGQYRANVAMTQQNIANDLTKERKFTESMREYLQALDNYWALYKEGLLQFSTEVNIVSNRIAEVAWMQLTDENVPAVDKERAKAALDNALKKLASIKSLGTTDGQRFGGLLDTLKTCKTYWPMREEWQEIYPNLTDDLIQVCVTLLDLAAETLAHSSPTFLKERYEQDLKPALDSVLTILLEHGNPDHIALWHLRTQGLRAQRQAVAAGRMQDPELAKLDQLYEEIAKLDHEFLGSNRGPITSYQLSNGNAASSLTQSWYASGIAEKRDGLWGELQGLEGQLREAGKLPAIWDSLDLDILGKRLQDMQQSQQKTQPCAAALLLLIPKDEQSLIVICLRAGDHARDDGGELSGLGNLKPSYQSTLHFVDMTTGEAALVELLDRLTREAHDGSNRVRGLAGDVAEASGTTSRVDDANPVANTDARQAESIPIHVAVQTLQSAQTDSRTDAGHSAELATLRANWMNAPNVLLSVLTELHSNEQISEVHIVPSRGLHLAPWAASLDGCIEGLRVRQFPTTGSWWRVIGDEVRVRGNVSEPTRWASLAFDAINTSRELNWVGLEAQAIQLIWNLCPAVHGQNRIEQLNLSNPQWPKPGQNGAAPIQSIQGIGHGGSKENNWALAGLFLGEDSRTKIDNYLTGFDLSGIKEALRLVMSCCVLGRLLNTQGEPIGMMAVAFAFSTRLGIGAMVPIPDFEGALFSMALHFALATAETEAIADNKHLDWSAVFHETRRRIMEGKWPDRFNAWLLQNLSELATNLGDDLDRRRKHQLEDLATDCKSGQLKAAIAFIAAAPTAEVIAVASMFTCLG